MTSPPPPDEWPSRPPLPDDALTNGQVFAGYQIIGLLGSGGMGKVYLAQHPRLPRRDALKLLPRDWSADADYRARFNREADLASTLWHPNIVGVHDRGEADGQLWISMDYVDGLDAARLVAERHPTGMPAEEVAQIVIAVARALDSAHKRGLLHRDVKPANIMITHLDDDGEQRILLTDFGLARDVNDDRGFTATEMTLGTVAYCAPEQLLGEDVDGRADQYALAATAYALLTGRPVFPDSDPSVVVGHQIDTTPTALAQMRPELASLDPVLALALAKRPEDRFARCSDFARALSEQIAATVVPSPRADPYGHVDPAGQRPSDHLPPPEQVSVEDRFTEPLTVDPRVVAPKPKQFRLWPIVAGVAGVLVVGLAAWLLWPSSGGPDSSGADAAQPTPTTANAEAQQKLLGVLPVGYPSSACTPADVPQGALAKVSCARNADAGGPSSATYTLLGDKAALSSAFDAEVRDTRVVNCPGNIQSPGPWRRNATPQQVSGTLVCGFKDDVPTLVWTDDDDLLLSSVDGADSGPNLDQLYVWWSSHS
jgi:serine/threonine-protein kinase